MKLGKTESAELAINIKTLQMHFACFGSLGNGKTTVASKVLIKELALFPTWKCRLENKKTKEARDIHLDGIFANIIENKA